MYTYNNGNYVVSIKKDGTRTKVCNDSQFIADYPDNIDCKITNWCNNPICMKHCHEKSNPNGLHGDIEFGLDFLSCLPAGAEIAIGGGATQSHPRLKQFLVGLRKIGLIPNLTINQHQFTEELCDNLTDWYNNQLTFGVGVSYTGTNQLHKAFTDNNTDFVWHLIAGVHTPKDLHNIIKTSKNTPKVLLLGYKEFGNGVNYFSAHKAEVTEKLKQWYIQLHEFITNGIVLSFDNLAINQLNVKRFFSDEQWNEFYQGDDGEANMYIDLVTKTAAVSSRSSNKFDITNMPLKQAFNQIKNQKEIY